MIENTLIIRWLGQQDYQTCWQAMQQFTEKRHAETYDEIWLLEHSPVFTQGQNGKAEHILDAGNIPIVQTDRGGQVTYHGPGQLMVYTLIDLKRKSFNVRQFVSALEQSVIDFLKQFNINAYAKCKAPGVYIQDGVERKICSIGLRVRRGCTYHGLAFNIFMDLNPFTRINPCGFTALAMAQLADYGGPKEPLTAGEALINFLKINLRYTTANYIVD